MNAESSDQQLRTVYASFEQHFDAQRLEQHTRVCDEAARDSGVPVWAVKLAQVEPHPQGVPSHRHRPTSTATSAFRIVQDGRLASHQITTCSRSAPFLSPPYAELAHPVTCNTVCDEYDADLVVPPSCGSIAYLPAELEQEAHCLADLQRSLAGRIVITDDKETDVLTRPGVRSAIEPTHRARQASRSSASEAASLGTLSKIGIKTDPTRVRTVFATMKHVVSTTLGIMSEADFDSFSRTCAALTWTEYIDYARSRSGDNGLVSLFDACERLFGETALESIQNWCKTLSPAADRSDTDPSAVHSGIVDAWRSRICDVCLMFECSNHGLQTQQVPHRYPRLTQSGRVARRLSRHASSTPCSASCHLHGLPAGPRSIISPEQMALFKLLVRPAPDATPCSLAPLLGLPCDQVHELFEGEPDGGRPNLVETITSARQLPASAHTGGLLLTDDGKPYQTCECHETIRGCDGPQCTCCENGTYCDRFCGCPTSCPRRFPGCRCVQSTAELCRLRRDRSELCPCAQAGRECDPSLCACSTSCHNRNLQNYASKYKETVIGESLVCSGYGLFYADEDECQHGEFIEEYRGEILDDYTGDSRGHLYSLRKTSYIFDLTADSCVDAEHAGSPARFINQPLDPAAATGNAHQRRLHRPNVFVRILQVNGVARAGVFASTVISRGHELLMNYGERYTCS